jgi:biopolymer transport protein ExbD
MKVETTHKRISTSILISLTDVIFLLLIFLMLASNFITQSGINIRLPGSSSGVQQNLRTLEVVYNNRDDIVLNNIKMNLEQFQMDLPLYFKTNEQVVRLIADKSISLQEVIGIMDILRNTGFEKITIATQKTSAPTSETK